MKIHFLLPLLGVILGSCLDVSATSMYVVSCRDVFSEYEKYIVLATGVSPISTAIKGISTQQVTTYVAAREPQAKMCSQDSDCAVPGMTRKCEAVILGGKTFGIKLCCAHTRSVDALFTLTIRGFQEAFVNQSSSATPEMLRHEIGRMLKDYETIKEELDFTALGNVATQFQQVSKSVNVRCAQIKCSQNCDFGYKMAKHEGTTPFCPSCDCEEDPCKANSCDSKEKCHLIRFPPPEVQSYSADPRMFWVFAECRKVMKPGSCPWGGMSFLDSGSCALSCSSDHECRGDGKCCATMCGTKCVQPRGLKPRVPQKTTARGQASDPGPPNTAAPTTSNKPNMTKPLQPPKPCNRTSSPVGDCHKKLDEAIKTLLNDTNSMPFLPRCKWDGSWQEIQLNDATGISWCVKETDGKPIEKTEVRGVPQCKDGVEHVSCDMVVFPEYEKKIKEEAIRRGVSEDIPISAIVLGVSVKDVMDAIKELEPLTKYCSKDSDCAETGITRACKPVVLGGREFGISVCCPHARPKPVQQKPVDECQGKKCPISSCFLRPQCRAFPMAVCRANPCKNCALEFYMPGEATPVDCYKDFGTTCFKQRDDANRDYLTKILNTVFTFYEEDKRMSKLYLPFMSQVIKIFYGGHYEHFLSDEIRLKMAMDIYRGVMKVLAAPSPPGTGFSTGRKKRSAYAVPSDHLSEETLDTMMDVLDVFVDISANALDCLHLGVDEMIKYSTDYVMHLGNSGFLQRIEKTLSDPQALKGVSQWSDNSNRELALRLMTFGGFDLSYTDSALVMVNKLFPIFNQTLASISANSFKGFTVGMVRDEFIEKFGAFFAGLLLTPSLGSQGIDYSVTISSILGRTMSSPYLEPTGADVFKAIGVCAKQPPPGDRLCQVMGPCNPNLNKPEEPGKESWKDMFYFDTKTSSLHKYAYSPLCAAVKQGTLFMSKWGGEAICGPVPYFSGIHVPVCTQNGLFGFKQCQSGICWCVSTDGLPKTGTHTTGSLTCGANGPTQISPIAKCGDGTAFKNCKDACKNQLDGTKFCRADPCNNCKLDFREIAKYPKDEKKQIAKLNPFVGPAHEVLRNISTALLNILPSSLNSSTASFVPYMNMIERLSPPVKKIVLRELTLLIIDQKLVCPTKCPSNQCPVAGFKMVDGCRPNAMCACAEDPCKKINCSAIPGSVCKVVKPKEPFGLLFSAVAECRLANKPGNCPCGIDHDVSCKRDCTNDLDCEGTMKCCRSGCGAKCLPVNGTEARKAMDMQLMEMNGTIWVPDVDDKNTWMGFKKDQLKKCDTDKDCDQATMEKCAKHYIMPFLGCNTSKSISVCTLVHKMREGPKFMAMQHECKAGSTTGKNASTPGKKPNGTTASKPEDDPPMDTMCHKECENDHDCADMMKCQHRGCSSNCMCVKQKLTGCHLELKQQIEVLRHNSQQPPFLPRCNKDGTYQAMQLHDSLGLSWCVQPDGKKISGTRRGEIDCSSKFPPPNDDTVCDAGEKVHNCPHKLCMMFESLCPGDPAAVCRVHPCGGCFVKFFNGTTAVTTCEGTKPCLNQKVAELRQKALKATEMMMNMQKEELDMISNGLFLKHSGHHDEVKMMIGEFMADNFMSMMNEMTNVTKPGPPKAPNTTQTGKSVKDLDSKKFKCHMEMMMFKVKQFHKKLTCKGFGVPDDFLGEIIRVAMGKFLSSIIGKPMRMPMGMGKGLGMGDKGLMGMEGDLLGGIEGNFMPGPDIDTMPKEMKEMIMKMLGGDDEDEDGMPCSKGNTTTPRPNVNSTCTNKTSSGKPSGSTAGGAAGGKPCGAQTSQPMPPACGASKQMMNKNKRHDLDLLFFEMERRDEQGFCLHSDMKMKNDKEDMSRQMQNFTHFCNMPPPDLKQCMREKAASKDNMKSQNKNMPEQACKPMDLILLVKSVILGQKPIHAMDPYKMRARYYYNSTSKTCMKYEDTGCGRNATDFSTMLGCEMICKNASMFHGKSVTKCNGTTGGYTNMQCKNGMCWCLIRDGKPVDSTLSRGPIECDNSGKRLKPLNDQDLVKCTGGKQPEIAKCLTACQDRPTCLTAEWKEAMCVADPCSSCKTTFQTHDGKKATCIDKVEMCKFNAADYATPDPKSCFKLQWRYDATSFMCKPFTNNRCDAKYAKFQDAKMCRHICSDPQSYQIKCSKPTDQPKVCYPSPCPKSCQKGVRCVVDHCTCTFKLYDDMHGGKEIKKCEDAQVGQLDPDEIAENEQFKLFNKTCMVKGTDHDTFKKCLGDRHVIIKNMTSKELMMAAHHTLQIEHLSSLTKCPNCADCATTKCPFGFAYKLVNDVMCQDGCTCARTDPCLKLKCNAGEKCVMSGREKLPFGPVAECVKQNKPGKCPCVKPPYAGISCELQCKDDSDCPSKDKCCNTACGRSCMTTTGDVLNGYMKSIIPKMQPNPCVNMEATPSFRIPKFDFCKVKSCSTEKDCDGNQYCQAPFSMLPTTLRICCPKLDPKPCQLKCPSNQTCQLEVAPCLVAPCPVFPKCKDRCPLNCKPGFTCKLVQVQCVRAPCPPLPQCVAIESECPKVPPGRMGTCAEECPEGGCPDGKKCCSNGCGHTCQVPVPVAKQDDKKDDGVAKKDEEEKMRQKLEGMGLKCVNELPSCRAQLAEKVMKMKTMRKQPDFLPRCTREGNWQAVQCYDNVGICFCVNDKGERLEGTTVRGIPDCRDIAKKTVDKEPYDVCQGKGIPLMCDPTMCMQKGNGCPKHPMAVCRINPCGSKCTTEYFLAGSTPVTDCYADTSATSCPKRRKAAMHIEQLNRIINTKHMPMMEEMLMKKMPDIAFMLHSGVLGNVARIFRDVVRENKGVEGPSMPSLFRDAPKPCNPSAPKLEEKFKLVEEMLKCAKLEPMKDFMFDLIEKVIGDDKEDPEDKRENFAQLDMMFSSLVAMEKGMGVHQGGMRKGQDMGDDKDMGDQNDMMASGNDKMDKGGPMTDMVGDDLFAIDAKKYSFLGGMGDDQDCPMMAEKDKDGKMEKKMQGLTVEMMCNRRPQLDGCVKPGPYDPKKMKPNPMFYYDGVSKTCKGFMDYGCSKHATTFKTLSGCQLFCQVKASFVGVYVPQCNMTTSKFNPMQTHNGVSWCVNDNGVPQVDTLHHGWDLQCDSKGKATPGPMSKKVTCPGAAQPQICDKACVKGVDHNEKGVVTCKADPCDGCKETFVNAAGAPVATATNRCNRPTKTVEDYSIDPKCMKKQYYYDSNTKMCTMYKVDGCKKIDDQEKKFDSLQDCMMICGITNEVRKCAQGAKRLICGIDNCKTKCNSQTDPLKNTVCMMDQCDGCKAKLYHSETWKQVSTCAQPPASSVQYMVKNADLSLQKFLVTLKACKTGGNMGKTFRDMMYFFLESKNMQVTEAAIKVKQAMMMCNTNCPKCPANVVCPFGYKLTCGCTESCNCADDPCKNTICNANETCGYIKLPLGQMKVDMMIPECRPVAPKTGQCPDWMTPEDGGSTNMTCTSDADCIRNDKCCQTGLGNKCMAPYIYGMGKPMYSDEQRLRHILMKVKGNPCGGMEKFDWSRVKGCKEDKDCASMNGVCNKLSPMIDGVVCKDTAICCPKRKEECTDMCKTDSDCMQGKACMKTSCGMMCSYPCKNKASCHYHLARRIKLLGSSMCSVKPGIFLPRCHADGSWKRIQCQDNIGMCWCVDTKNGTKINGTMKRGIPDCSKKTLPEPTVCPNNIQAKSCSCGMCEMFKTCTDYPQAICRVNPCGAMCEVEYYMKDQDGNEKVIKQADCDKKIDNTPCGASMKRSYETLFMNSMIGMAKDKEMRMHMESLAIPTKYFYHTGLKDTFMENMKMWLKGAFTGDVKPMKDSKEKNRTDAADDKKPGEPLRPAYDLGNGKIKIRVDALKILVKESLGCVRDLAGLDEMLWRMMLGDYMGLKNGGRKNDSRPMTCKNGTATTDRKNCTMHMPEMYKPDDYVVVGLQMDEMSMAMGKMMMAGMPIDVKMDMMQHHEIFGPPPPVKKPEMMMSDMMKEDDMQAAMPKLEMLHDQGFRKMMCMKAPTLQCLLGLNVNQTMKGQMSKGHELYYFDKKEKKCMSYIDYKCKHDPDTGVFLMKSSCEVMCEESPKVTSLFMPKCSWDTSGKMEFQNKQCHGLYCFCVSKAGAPNAATITKDKLECDANGNQINSDFKQAKCPNGSSALICHDKCMMPCDYAGGSPAVCVVDPCDNCKTMWQDTKGNEVKCEPARTQSAYDAGIECQATKPQQIWYFDSATSQCKNDTYKGCGGNGNRFMTKCDCMERGQSTTCPTKQAIKICDLTTLCKDKMCAMNSSVVCTADPCTCQQIYIDTRNRSMVEKCDFNASVHNVTKPPCKPESPLDAVLSRLRGHKDFDALVNIIKTFKGAYPDDIKIIQALHDFLVKASFSESEKKLLQMAFGVWLTYQNKCPTGSNCKYDACAKSPCQTGQGCADFKFPMIGNHMWRARECRNVTKIGMCPCPAHMLFKAFPTERKCATDGDCRGKAKCCRAGYSSMCMNPVKPMKMEEEGMCKKKEEKKEDKPCKPVPVPTRAPQKPARLPGVCQTGEECGTGFKCTNNFCVCDDGVKQVDPNSCHGKLYKVQRMLKQLKNLLPPNKMVGIFIPRCHENNTYQTVQVYDHLGLMFCVDPKTGQKTSDRIRGIPDCTKPKKTGTEPVCQTGKTTFCPVSICEHAMCPDYPDATCLINPCGGCKPEFYRDSGEPVKCFKKQDASADPCEKMLHQNIKAQIDQKTKIMNPAMTPSTAMMENMIDHQIMVRSGKMMMGVSMEQVKRKKMSFLHSLNMYNDGGAASGSNGGKGSAAGGKGVDVQAKKKSDDFVADKAFQCANVGYNMKKMYLSMMSKVKADNEMTMEEVDANKLITATFKKLDAFLYNWGLTPREDLSETVLSTLAADLKNVEDMHDDMMPVDTDDKKCENKTGDEMKPHKTLAPDDEVMKHLKARGNMVCNMMRHSGDFAEELKSKQRPSNDSAPPEDICATKPVDDALCKGKATNEMTTFYYYKDKKCISEKAKKCAMTANTIQSKLMCMARCMAQVQPRFYGVFIPKCNATLKGFSAKQSHSGISWCVNVTGQIMKSPVVGENIDCPANTRQARAVTTLSPPSCSNGKKFRTCEKACANVSACIYSKYVHCTADPCDDCKLSWRTEADEDVTQQCETWKPVEICPDGTFNICPDNVCDSNEGKCEKDNLGTVHCIPDCSCKPKLHRYDPTKNRLEELTSNDKFCTDNPKSKRVSITIKAPFQQLINYIKEQLESFIESLMRAFNLIREFFENISFKEGSIVVSFTVTAPNAAAIAQHISNTAKDGSVKITINGTIYDMDSKVSITDPDVTTTTPGPKVTPVDEKMTLIIFGSCIGGVALLTIVMLIVILLCRRKMQNEKKQLKSYPDEQKFANPGFNMNDDNYKSGHA